MLIKDYRRLLLRLLIRSYQRASAAVVEKQEIQIILRALKAPKWKPKKRRRKP